jgi:hypothetical protein
MQRSILSVLNVSERRGDIRFFDSPESLGTVCLKLGLVMTVIADLRMLSVFLFSLNFDAHGSPLN